MSKQVSAKRRLIVSGIAGIALGVMLLLLGAAKFAPLGAWDIAALTYIGWIWITIWKMTAAQTKTHANTEDPGRALADILLIIASIISIGAVGLMITQASSSSGLEKAIEVALGLFSVVVSWAVVHTTYTLKYATLYYGNPEGGIDFNNNTAPKYTDFAYVAFTVGLTFQVSDTNIQTNEIRRTILKHALLSYLFGAVIIATTINTIANLGK
jgi:uncharacterized membrane protein